MLATMWSMWIRPLIRLSFCLRNFYGYLLGLRQIGHGAFHEASLKDPPKTATAGSTRPGAGSMYRGPSLPGGLRDASQRPQTPLRRLQTPPNGPQMSQEASKTVQEASKRPQEAPRPPQDVQNPSKMELSWHQNRIQNRS